jgi:hypothetical protein
MIITYGQATVAQWCGVESATVAMWITRGPMQPRGTEPAEGELPGWPEPDTETRSPRSVTRGWLEERKAEWRRYAAIRAEQPGAQLVALRKDRQAS